MKTYPWYNWPRSRKRPDFRTWYQIVWAAPFILLAAALLFLAAFLYGIGRFSVREGIMLWRSAT